MENTIVVYGSSTGTCQGIAETIAQKLGTTAIDVSKATAETFSTAGFLVLGTSTWGAGEMQDDWYDGIKTLKEASISGKKLAIFGCGDGETYSDTFCGGMREIYDAVLKAGASVIGQTSAEGYTFDESEAVIDDHFVGLALDEDNESDLTEARIDKWIEALKRSL